MPNSIKILSIIPPTQRMWVVTEEDVQQEDITMRKEQFCDAVDILVTVEHIQGEAHYTTVEPISLNWLKYDSIEDLVDSISVQYVVREHDFNFDIIKKTIDTFEPRP